MCDGALLDKLDYIGRRVRHNPHTPFGGLQLVFCGDFFQLPPVPDELDNVKVPITFAFEARCWKDAVPWNFTLTHVFRQKEQAFIDILNQARTGSLSPAAIAAFRRLERPLAFTDGIEPTRIFPKKDQVKRANDTRLALLRSQPHKFMARDFAGNDSRGNPLSPADATKKLDRNVVAPASITLKEGAQVMLVTVRDPFRSESCTDARSAESRARLSR
ncbi:hypothetical protein CALVIDRAFT_212465 [Calocera viscosa TUFC12733]|uniref:ATP-dependent DNA helicase n=1 Tax=Calocera viscosa (strain TUFC12733) TaxID=1330018 RepID=A0A167RCE4_CALVF|nr:hypothetical protein CALVIDRAFT_212465 [Calocera viscosa TUFC12733]